MPALRSSIIQGYADKCLQKMTEFFPVLMNWNEPPAPVGFQQENFFTPETQFSTRFFTVWVDNNNQIIRENTDRISSVDKDDAREYAEKVLSSGDERGWISNYRYRVLDTRVWKIVGLCKRRDEQRDDQSFTVFGVLCFSR